MDGSTYDMPITSIRRAMRRAMSTVTLTVAVAVAAF
jgi:hypothetical protein